MSQSTNEQQIMFDLDDTLVYTNKYFFLILEQFVDVMGTWFRPFNISEHQVKQKQIDIDMERVQQDGFASHHFPESFVETYHYYSHVFGRSVHPHEEELLYKLGLSVYKQPVEPYPNMVETLSRLQNEGHQLYLYTGGESDIQQRKIDAMQLQQFFEDRIFVRQHKNQAALEAILEGGKFDRTRTWMIGNSLRTDISPALHAGISTIYIEQQNEWKYNIVDFKLPPYATMYTTKVLGNVPDIIAQHLTSFRAL